MNFFNYPGDRTVKAQHDIPLQDGTIEHMGFVKLTDIKSLDYSNDTLVVHCPVEGCDSQAYVPITGGTEAQLLHAQWLYAQGIWNTLADAITSVREHVQSRGFNAYVHHGYIVDHETGEANSFMLPGKLSVQTDSQEEPVASTSTKLPPLTPEQIEQIAQIIMQSRG